MEYLVKNTIKEESCKDLQHIITFRYCLQLEDQILIFFVKTDQLRY